MPAAIDHLLYASPDLETGMDAIERDTGVRPRVGGRHPGQGTHNALLSLGPRTYLEVIAPDPTQSESGLQLPYGIGSLTVPALRAWAAAPDDIDDAVRRACEAGVDYGEIGAHSRQTPEGADVSWRMALQRTSVPGVTVVPFLIDWGTTTHPALGSPGGVRLVAFRVLTPEPGDVERKLLAIGAGAEAGVRVSTAAVPALEAMLVGATGQELVLRS